MTNLDCLFCKVATGDIPAEIVAETDSLLAFRDIDPQAPLHVLVIPREHVTSLGEAAEGDSRLLGEALLLAARIARDEGVAADGYRTVINTGEHGGQTVHHLHVHLLAGRAMAWPPG